MDPMYNAIEIKVGFHLDGCRIDKTASPTNRYTKWEILPGRGWCNPQPVSFDSLPQEGWIPMDRFDWGYPIMTWQGGL